MMLLECQIFFVVYVNCKLYILKTHITMFHENLLDDENLMCYSFQLGNKWITNKIDMDTFRNIMNRIK
jgi:hypothetical protein